MFIINVIVYKVVKFWIVFCKSLDKMNFCLCIIYWFIFIRCLYKKLNFKMLIILCKVLMKIKNIVFLEKMSVVLFKIKIFKVVFLIYLFF